MSKYLHILKGGGVVLSRPLLTQYGEIGSVYPTNVYGGNRLSLPILRQKIGLSDV